MNQTGRKVKKQDGIIKTVIIMIILAAMLVGFYFYVSYKMEKEKASDNMVITKTQQVLMRDLVKNYPPSPKELIKYYSEITQCFYNEEHDDNELETLALQMQMLYDVELVENQTQEEYMASLKKDIASMRTNNYTISSYAPSSSTDVEYFSKDGYEWAKLYCTYVIRKGSQKFNSEEQFLLRKDSSDHWKIYGWKLAE